MGKSSYIESVVTVLVCITTNMANAQAGTLGFYLNGTAYPNGSTVLRTDIGEGDDALQCTTNSTTCCTNSNGEIRAGEFYFPSGAIVPHMGLITNGYYRLRGSQHIRLHRQPSGTITGWFRCNIPQASGPPDANLYINIVDISVSITPSGTATVGQRYSLTCSVAVTGSTDISTIVWLGPINNKITTGLVTTGSMSTLTFSPLAAAHAGIYTCEVRVGGAVMSEKIMVIVQEVGHGVSLKLQGTVLPNNSIVDIDDLLYTTPSSCCNELPSNARPDLHDQALLCITDLEYCCEFPSLGYWYYPNGSIVQFDAGNSATLLANRGQNEVINGRQFYGSVRLFRRYGRPPGRGHFHCELPNAADPSTNQILYANILNFGFGVIFDPVTISSSGSNVAGETYSLMCSATLFDPVPLPSNVPSPTFEWSFGPSGKLLNASKSLPSGVTPMTTTSSSNSTSITYTSTLQFSPLTQSHAGTYTCRLGAASLVKSANVTVNGARVHHVYLSLKGTVYNNNSIISITEIGQTNTSTTVNTGLQCITDRRPCCRQFEDRTGEWHFPDGTTIPPKFIATTFYRNRGDDGTVNLNRISTNVTMPTGLFCCEVPDATSVIQRVCANIVCNTEKAGRSLRTRPVFYNVVITPSASGIPTAGDATYSLNCSVSGMAADPATYQWFKGSADNRTLLTSDRSRTVVSNSSISQLQFSLLLASHAGLYICQATVGGVVVKGTTNVTVNFPAPIIVTVTPSVIPIIFAGSSLNLTCTVELSPLVDVPVTVNTVWTGPAGFMTNNTAQPVMGNTTTYTSVVMVASIGRYQSENYSCTVNIGAISPFYADSVGYSSLRITVVPEPTVSLHSDMPNPLLSGSSLTLTCTAELSSEVNFPLSVSTTWKGPDGTIIITSTEMKSVTLYMSSHTLFFLESMDSGEYACTMNFRSGIEVSASTNITIVDAMFQLRLRSVDICQWHHNEFEDSKSDQYSNFIKRALIKAIGHHCRCYFPTANLLSEDTFICEDLPNLMIYRNVLIGTHNYNGTRINDFIQEWVSNGPLIKIDGNSVRVDSSCPTAISSLNESTCGQNKECLYNMQ